MRAFCTVSAPLEVCAPPTRPLSPGSRFLALKLLGTPQPRTLYFLVEAKSRVREVYAQTCLYFAKQGMLDTELFGLAVLIDGEYFFADPESKLSKYGPKSWRSSHTHGLDANGRPLLEFHFRVQFYIESPLMLRDETTRHNYYLQLKVNTIGRDLPRDCAEQTIVLLGGLALQADLGDAPTTAVTAAAAAASDDGGGTSTPTGTADANAAADYFRLEDYVPASMRTAWYSQTLQSCHRKYRGMPKADAETHFIREVCNLKEAINAHYFRMKLSKSETGVGSVWLIVYAKGLKIYEENPVQTNTFLWPNISKLSFERKKFEIRSADSKIILYSANDEKNKMILALCRDTHQFSMKTAARLSEAIKREEEAEAEAAEQSQLGLHAYMYSRSLNLPYKNKNDQRISVISSTSSNTTSGIVSDRVHSEDELEIMINTPPATQIAAPSTESLALAHLLDKPSVSRQTSSVGRVSLKDLEDTLAALSIRSNTRSSGGGSETASVDASDAVIPASESDSPNSQNNIGSQCSSTCSTVVVATDTIAMPSSPTTTVTAATRRRPSTSSSLELGFSHTAQNSALSEGQSACYGTTTLDNNDNDEDGASGVYNLAHPPPTETSGVYTMNSSEMTGQSSECAESESHASSSHYGSFQPMGGKNGDASVTSSSMDAVDGQFRMRSDSNVSASGSFRGDGSDPTDKKHALLSAEELTDLIVGRGTYPPRTTVSDTLDSDCDYVTLPLPLEGDSYLQGHEDTAPTDDDQYDDDLMPTDPPAPPKRVDSNVHRSLSCLLDIRMRSPPPYEARHETTGLCGPPVPARDPPPYPQPLPRAVPAVPVQPVHQQEQSTIPPPPIPTTSMPEEATARFITTRPHINILKANTSMVGEKAKPSYAVPSSISVPSMPYSMHAAHKSMSALSAPQPPPYPDMQKAPRTCLLLPVIKPRQYLPPPPPSLPRQPPPPPPTSSHQLATVYTSQLARSQIELYQQQLYSDVDYVIYPLQDPAVSQQEYLDAKQGSILAAMAQNGPPPPPSYLAYRTHHQTNGAIYRSTPYLSMTFSSPHSRYASTQNLSDTYVQLPSTYSPLYSPSVASLCSSYEPPPPPPLRPRPYHKQMHTVSAPMFVRSRSDDNILNSIETAPTHKQLRRLPPPPPPPPPYQCRKPLPKPPRLSPPPPLAAKKSDILRRTSLPIGAMPTGVAPQTFHPVHPVYPAPSAPPHPTTPSSPDSAIDINTLREKSKHLDLPLISALCNDRSLLKQTKAFVMPKHPKMGIAAQQQQQQSQQMQQHHQQQHLMMQQHQSQLHSMTTTGQLLMSSTPHLGKYPVSGLSTTQLQKPRKTSVSHRHPNDKLPPLPMHTAVAQCGNNYVLDPTPTAIKHKSYNSQT